MGEKMNKIMSFSKISENQSNVEKRFNLFILLYIAVFSLIPILTRNVIPFDMVENLYWGKEWQLGYSKHPPLFAWISEAFFRLFFSIPESLYILTQLNLLVGLFFIFRISQLIYSNRIKSYASVFIFMSSTAAILGNEKFNATTILFSLLPATFYYFLSMLKFGKKKDAVLLGIFATLACIGKYISCLFLGCIGIFLLFNSNCRKLLRTPLPYIALATFLLGISWHVYWIYSNDFVTITYALEKSALAKKSPMFALTFSLMMLLFYGTSLLASCCAFPSDKFLNAKKFKLKEIFSNVNFLWKKGESYSTEELFIIVITLAPSAILFFMALCTGMRIGSFWGASMMTTIGIYLVVINKKHLDISLLFKFTKGILFFFSFVLIIKLGIAPQFLKNSHPSFAIDYRKVSRQIEQDYDHSFPKEKIKHIISDKSTTPLHAYLKDYPSFYNPDLLGKRKNNFKNRIVTFIYKNTNDIKNFQKSYNDDIVFENDVDVYGEWKIHYAFLRNQ